MDGGVSDIPDDIWSVAEKVFDRVWWTDRAQNTGVEPIAEAIMAERERCADIAADALNSYDTMDQIPQLIRAQAKEGQ